MLRHGGQLANPPVPAAASVGGTAAVTSSVDPYIRQQSTGFTGTGAGSATGGTAAGATSTGGTAGAGVDTTGTGAGTAAPAYNAPGGGYSGGGYYNGGSGTVVVPSGGNGVVGTTPNVNV